MRNIKVLPRVSGKTNEKYVLCNILGQPSKLSDNRDKSKTCYDRVKVYSTAGSFPDIYAKRYACVPRAISTELATGIFTRYSEFYIFL